MMVKGEEVVFAEDTETIPSEESQERWKLIISDDDEQVHSVTRMVLDGYTFLGRGLEILSAYSSAETKELLDAHPDAAVVLLDVVMESDESGLTLVQYIRNEKKNSSMRVILRTGQAGYAPEERVIREYDINDYKEKSELTSQKLISSVTIAIRTYHEIMQRIRLEEEKLQMERRLRQVCKMESLGTLAGGIAHDFNNILSAVIGYVQLSIRDFGSELKLRGYLTEVLSASYRAADLVKQILTFSRHSEEEKHVPVELNLIGKEVLKLMRATMPSAIEIERRISCRSCWIMGSPGQIHQVIMNLCVNACHAMKENGGVLTLEVHAEEVLAEKAEELQLPAGRYARFIVRDTGNGIPADIQERIFDPYFTTKGPGEGTGLGLSVVYGIVQAHGGSVFLESSVGEGTAFTIYFPLAEVASDNAHEEEEVLMGTEHLLLVDDEEKIGTTVKALLQGYGYTVDVCMNSVEAWQRFQVDPDAYDMLITNNTMPDLSGVQLAERVLTTKPGFPVILWSGYSAGIDQEAMYKKGISRFLIKPVPAETLATIVRDVLDKK